MNDTLDTANNLNLKTDFNSLMNLVSTQYKYENLITLLNSENIAEKQLAVLELCEIKSEKDAFTLISNLVGQDGKIREAVAFKIKLLSLNPEFTNFFIGEKFFDIYFQGIMDINGNVCRQIVDLIKLKGFKKYLSERLPQTISEKLVEIAAQSKNEKQYKLSKRNFQLYWLLECLAEIIDICDISKFNEIIKQCSEFEDYTIREKTAKILSKINSNEFDDIKNILKNDENYYVRRLLN